MNGPESLGGITPHSDCDSDISGLLGGSKSSVSASLLGSRIMGGVGDILVAGGGSELCAISSLAAPVTTSQGKSYFWRLL